MQFLSIAFAAAMATCTLAQSTVTRCGTTDPPETMKFALDQAAFRGGGVFRNGTRNVETYAHVVTTQAKEGTYTQQQIQSQIEVMNRAYGPSGFQFNLVDVDFTANNEWATAGQATQVELEMKTALHQGSYESLNLYFLSDLGGGLLGFCYFPLENPTDNDRTLDGCVNIAGSLPDANELPDYALGLTTVHETGHWLGLFHVFQGNSCSGQGDYISDTPAQLSPTEGCPAQADTCPGSPGQDSIHNYMDYSYDECLDSFTRQQGQRMFTVFDQYRAGK
ncbi:hypothetical protein LTR37_016316 [Vermiconidia calcicola]|uniref:Uncharacterized protein n=1 Tax=Vermiconidia calcicola TaxID=1690605 RepID=A0ACC3MNT6_9PEZI|nr:hypothetical protein LTR37_016316 [Vermiconidia calcicola]